MYKQLQEHENIKETEGFQECLDNLKSVRFMSPNKIENQMNIVLLVARDFLNNGKRGNGVSGTAMACFYSIWVTFYNENIVKLSDKFDMAGSLSVYDRIDDPSNQGHEGSNKDLNATHRISSNYQKPTLRSWCEGCQDLEKRFDQYCHFSFHFSLHTKKWGGKRRAKNGPPKPAREKRHAKNGPPKPAREKRTAKNGPRKTARENDVPKTARQKRRAKISLAKTERQK